MIGMLCYDTKGLLSLTFSIRVENNAKMNHVVLRVVSHVNADRRGHIKDKELV